MRLCFTAPHAPRGGPSLTTCPDFASNGSYVCASRGRSRKEEENDNNHNIIPPQRGRPQHQSTIKNTTTTTTSTAYSDTFPAVNSAILGTCPPEVHDRYFVIGPDGRKYRTWHPVTVPIDPSNPSRGTCTFAHEHGDNPIQGRFRDLPSLRLPFKGRWNG
jgi:hypothetical protein